MKEKKETKDKKIKVENKKKDNKKTFSIKIFLFTILMDVFVVTCVLSVIYYIKVTPSKSTDIHKNDTTTVTKYYNTGKEIPVLVNIETQNYKAYSYFDTTLEYVKEELKQEAKVVKNTKELNAYIKEVVDDNKISFYDSENKIESINYFDDEFFKNKNLAIFVEGTSEYKPYIQGIFTNEKNEVTVSIRDAYDPTTFIIPTGVEIWFIAFDKEVDFVNYEVYRTTRIYEDKDLQIVITLATIILITLSLVFILIYNINPKKDENKETQEKNIVLSIVLGMVTSLSMFAIIYSVLIILNIIA